MSPQPIIVADYASTDHENKTPVVKECMARGIDVLITRATWGVTPDVDDLHRPTPLRDAMKIRVQGAVYGDYLFVRTPTQQHPDCPSPEEQADAYKHHSQCQRGDLPPIIDMEQQSTLGPADYLDWHHRAWRRVKENFGVAPIIYTSQRVVMEYIGKLAKPEMKESLTWVAKPWPLAIRSRADTSGAQKYGPHELPDTWGPWIMYQYQGDAIGVPGFGKPADLSRWRTVRYGARGHIVEWIQRRCGMAEGTPSIWDDVTQAAVLAYQQKNGLVADGVVGPRTISQLAWEVT